MSLGFKLKQHRIANALTEQEVADIIGVNRITIYLWENDKSRPSMKNRRKLADLYQVSKKELL